METVKICRVHCYADDCLLHFTYDKSFIKSITEVINEELCAIVKWSKNHGLKINADKCSLLHVVPPDIRQVLKTGEYGNILINKQKHKINQKVKVLGVIVDEDVTMSEHFAQ